jgi:ketosteroid isomerase-like protein
MNAPEKVAHDFFAAIEAGDLAKVEALYAPEARIWHNTDGVAQSVSENLRVLAWMVRSIPSRQYRIVRREILPWGFFQQHVLALETAQGRYDMPACVVVMVEGGRIVRLDEYLDSAHVTAMRAALRL